jgi:hypothetical protein
MQELDWRPQFKSREAVSMTLQWYLAMLKGEEPRELCERQATYPVAWRIEVPGHQLALTVSTPLPNQELRTTAAGISYWEGMVQVTGTARGRAVAGRGYLEMTGYAGSLGRVMSLTAGR